MVHRHSCSPICCLNVCLQMLHDVSLLNMHHLHRANTGRINTHCSLLWCRSKVCNAMASGSQLSKLGGWVAHVSTTRHSITDLGSTKMEGKPICCENSFQICKVALKFGVNISDLSPHLTSKMLQKKIKMSTWKWHPNARCPTHRVKVLRHAAMQLTHLSRDIQRHVVISKEIHNHHEHSRTTPTAVAILQLYKWSGCVGAD